RAIHRGRVGIFHSVLERVVPAGLHVFRPVRLELVAGSSQARHRANGELLQSRRDGELAAHRANEVVPAAGGRLAPKQREIQVDEGAAAPLQDRFDQGRVARRAIRTPGRNSHGSTRGLFPSLAARWEKTLRYNCGFGEVAEWSNAADSKSVVL